MSSIFLTLAAFSTGAAARPAQLRVADNAKVCTLTMYGELVTDDALLNFTQTGSKTAVLDADPKASDRCVGGMIARLQKAGFRVLSVTVNGRPRTRPKRPQ